jgi:hypothetical protein
VPTFQLRNPGEGSQEGVQKTYQEDIREMQEEGRELKKPKYKEVTRAKRWVVIANYQPGSMWMTPDDTKRTTHISLESAMRALEKHMQAGASDIEIFHRFISMEMKP